MDPFMNPFSFQVLFLFPFVKIIHHDDIVVPQLIEVTHEGAANKSYRTGDDNHASTLSGVE